MISRLCGGQFNSLTGSMIDGKVRAASMLFGSVSRYTRGYKWGTISPGSALGSGRETRSPLLEDDEQAGDFLVRCDPQTRRCVPRAKKLVGNLHARDRKSSIQGLFADSGKNHLESGTHIYRTFGAGLCPSKKYQSRFTFKRSLLRLRRFFLQVLLHS